MKSLNQPRALLPCGTRKLFLFLPSQVGWRRGKISGKMHFRSWSTEIFPFSLCGTFTLDWGRDFSSFLTSPPPPSYPSSLSVKGIRAQLKGNKRFFYQQFLHRFFPFERFFSCFLKDWQNIWFKAFVSSRFFVLSWCSTRHAWAYMPSLAYFRFIRYLCTTLQGGWSLDWSLASSAFQAKLKCLCWLQSQKSYKLGFCDTSTGCLMKTALSLVKSFSLRVEWIMTDNATCEARSIIEKTFLVISIWLSSLPFANLFSSPLSLITRRYKWNFCINSLNLFFVGRIANGLFGGGWASRE